MVTSLLGGELIGIHSCGEAIYHHPYREECRGGARRDERVDDDDDDNDKNEEEDGGHEFEPMEERCSILEITSSAKNVIAIMHNSAGKILNDDCQ